MADRESLSIELDAEVAAGLRAQAADADLSEGEIVERALRAADLRSLAARIRSRSALGRGHRDAARSPGAGARPC